MAARRQPNKSSSPLDERQQKLLKEQEEIQQRTERVRAQRDELLVDRSTRAHHRLNSTTLADTRFEQYPGRAASRGRRRPLKAERRQTRLIFFALLLFLAVMVLWLLSVWHWQWPS
jgi:hypothetical protein